MFRHHGRRNRSRSSNVSISLKDIFTNLQVNKGGRSVSVVVGKFIYKRTIKLTDLHKLTKSYNNVLNSSTLNVTQWFFQYF